MSGSRLNDRDDHYHYYYYYCNHFIVSLTDSETRISQCVKKQGSLKELSVKGGEKFEIV